MNTSQTLTDTFLNNALPSTYSSTTVKKDEASLLKAAKKLDQVALTAIFDLYAPAIYGYIHVKDSLYVQDHVLTFFRKNQCV